MRRLATLATLVMLIVTVAAPAAQACGFLVSANGAVALGRTTTLVVWDDGVEHYTTNFEFAGDAESFGSLIPLPAEPTEVKRAGDWTLQRMQIEVGRQDLRLLSFADATAVEEAEVVLETKIDSLEVVVLRGGADSVLEWVNANGFNLPEGPETDHMLEFYASRSPYFMATRFDAAAAIEDGFVSGDGIPVQITIPVDRPWVPLHILHGAKADTDVIEADVFLITPDEPALLHGAGLSVNRTERASRELLDDLRSDVGMEWIPQSGWFTHLSLAADSEDLMYDLAIGVDGKSPTLEDAGLAPLGGDHPAAPIDLELVHEHPAGPSVGLIVGLAAAAGLIAGWVGARLRPRRLDSGMPLSSA